MSAELPGKNGVKLQQARTRAKCPLRFRGNARRNCVRSLRRPGRAQPVGGPEQGGIRAVQSLREDLTKARGPLLEQRRAYFLQTLIAAAEHSGGGLIAVVPRVVHDFPDRENNLMLDLAAEVGAPHR